MYNGINLSAM